ncbi:Phosphoribulokinase/uridine kinase domain-containing protein [Candidatus Magnetomoraceae bacterium gMMP-1]
MLSFCSYNLLFQYIRHTKINFCKQPSLILIGGCSRTGKTTLALKLFELFKADGVECNIINLDSWLVSLEKRKANSTVMERYECAAIIKAVKKILSKKKVFPPIYDIVSRRRISEKGEKFYFADSGVVIVEGVITLALKELVNIASLKIFTTACETTRIERLMDFYVNMKGLNYRDAEEIVYSREKEEVLFVKETSEYADLSFKSLK